MLGELVPCGGGDPIPLLKPKLLVGRRSRCDIALKFPNVSSHHCELQFLDGYWFVRDMRSRNGIKVNDIRCESKWLLPGDILSVARHRFQVVYSPQSDVPPPELEEDPFAQSLLEKAGLERPRRPEPDIPKQPRQTQQPAAEDETEETLGDDDLAVKWLSEETGES